jgi:7-cyano-7-deazaguanine reductase
MLQFFAMPSTVLETFPNPSPGRDYEIEIRCPEFTAVCPKTGLPDFGEITIRYVPGDLCIELKALKYYMIGFRNKGIFYEAATNQILDDLVAACGPRRMTVVGDFSVRGGISTTVTAGYERGKGQGTRDKGKGKRESAPRAVRNKSARGPSKR